MFVFLPFWYKQHPSLRSLFVSELPVFFPFIQDHYSSNLITNAARVTNLQHGALSYAFRLIFHGQENITARTCLRVLLIYLLKRQQNTNATILQQAAAVPLQAWSGQEGSKKLRLPDFMTAAQDGGKVVSLTYRPP